VFKPALDDFRAALRDYPPNFRNFMRFEPAIEGHRPALARKIQVTSAGRL
jgi:hypothetical protein